MARGIDEHVYPEPDSLEIIGSVDCPHCKALLPSQGSLRLHIVAKHEGQGGTLRAKTTKRWFYCPALDCQRHTRPFPRLGELKQHYGTVHAPQKFACDMCGKRFGMMSLCMRHKAHCGKTFDCVCGYTGRSKGALHMHCKRKGNGHSPVLAGGSQGKSRTICRSTATVATGTPPLSRHSRFGNATVPRQKTASVGLCTSDAATVSHCVATQTLSQETTTSPSRPKPVLTNTGCGTHNVLRLDMETQTNTVDALLSMTPYSPLSELGTAVDFGVQSCLSEILGGCLAVDASIQTDSDSADLSTYLSDRWQASTADSVQTADIGLQYDLSDLWPVSDVT